jgi:general secretion pathway protein F
MAIFRYKALTEMGKRVNGIIDADSYDLAKERLRARNVLVTKIEPLAKKKEVGLNPSMLLTFTRELTDLLGAGLPLYESLLTIEEKYQKHRAHPLLLDICDRLKGGEALSTILKTYPKSFDPIYISMVESGEKTGSLSWAFSQLNSLIERKQKLKKQLLGAMAYPSFLAGFCFLMILGLLLFVIPSMRELFEGRQLHPLTQLVLSMSQGLEHSLFLLIFSTGSLILSLYYFAQKPKGRLFLQRCLQKVPLIKTISTQAAFLRFSRSTSILLKGGVPLVSALSTSRRAMKHPLLEEAIERAEGQLIEGKSLSDELRRSPYIPLLVTRMVGIAEQTGKLPDMLMSLSEIYDHELERSLAHITTFLQPILLLILGGFVGIVILSILLPLADVSSLIQ